MAILKSVVPWLPTMKPLTAVAVLLAGIALWLFQEQAASLWRYRAGLICAGATAGIGAAVTAEYLFDVSLGVDRLLFERAVLADEAPFPGRPAPAIAGGLMLSGTAMLAFDWRRHLWMPLTSLVSLSIGLIAIVGYVLEAWTLFRLVPYHTMSLLTAILLVLLNLGILAARPAHPFVAEISGPGPGSRLMRQVLPLIVLMPLGIGWLRMIGQAGLGYSLEFGLMLSVTLNMGILAVLFYWTAHCLNHIEAERRNNRRAAQETEERLRLAWRATRDVIWDWDIVRDSQRWSAAGAEVFGWTDVVRATQTAQWWLDRVHPEDRERVSVGFHTALDDPSCEHWEGEYRFQKADGTYADVFDRGYVLRNAQGRPLRMIGAMQDISERKRAETALRESEFRLRRFYDSGLLGVIHWNMDGQILDANDKFLEMTGYERADLSAGLIDWERMTPLEYRHKDEQAINELLATGVVAAPFEKEYIRKDGARISVLAAGAMLDEKRFSGVGFVLDISERKRAEAALCESRFQLARELVDTQRLQKFSSQMIEDEFGEALYEQVVEAAMAIMKADFASFQRYDAERGELELIAWRNFHPESAEHWRYISAKNGTSCGSALQHGERIIIANVDTTALSIDSETRRHFHLSGIAAIQSTPLITRGGRLIGMISTHWRQPHLPREREFVFLDLLARQAADMLERRRSQEALRESEERLRFALEASGTGAWNIDLMTETVQRSLQHDRIFGYDHLLPEWNLARFFEHVLPEDRPAVAAVFQEAREGRGDYCLEYRIRRHGDGAVRWVWAAGRHRNDAGGQPLAIDGIIQDITERKQTEAELLKLNTELECRVKQRTAELLQNKEKLKASLEEKETLLKEIHHRVKNNLQIISSLIKMQSDGQTDPNAREQSLDSQRRIRSMALIHEQLYRTQDLKSIDFADYVRQLFGHIRRSFAQNPADVVGRLDMLPLTLNIDHALPLGLIINELVSNSFKHAFSHPCGGEMKAIWVTLTRDPLERLVLEVGDSGCGMPEDVDLEHSLSMGLQLVRSLVLQLHGRLTVECAHGTRFRIFLPDILADRISVEECE